MIELAENDWLFTPSAKSFRLPGMFPQDLANDYSEQFAESLTAFFSAQPTLDAEDVVFEASLVAGQIISARIEIPAVTLVDMNEVIQQGHNLDGYSVVYTLSRNEIPDDPDMTTYVLRFFASPSRSRRIRESIARHDEENQKLLDLRKIRSNGEWSDFADAVDATRNPDRNTYEPRSSGLYETKAAAAQRKRREKKANEIRQAQDIIERAEELARQKAEAARLRNLEFEKTPEGRLIAERRGKIEAARKEWRKRQREYRKKLDAHRRDPNNNPEPEYVGSFDPRSV